MLTEREAKELVAGLLGLWVDGGDDEAILNEEVRRGEVASLRASLDALRVYLASAEPPDSKAAFIRDAAYRWFPPDNSDERAMQWVRDLLPKIENAISRTTKGGTFLPHE